MRKVVANTGHPKIYGFIVGDPSISPDGDGVRDETTIGFTISQTATWTVEIRDAAGAVVRHMAGEGEVVETTWAGRDDNGKALPDGVYSLRADATSADGQARSATATLRLDTVAAQHRERRGRSGPVQPQRGRAGRRRHGDVRPERIRYGSRLRRRRRPERPPARDGLDGGDGRRADGGVGRAHLDGSRAQGGA